MSMRANQHRQHGATRPGVTDHRQRPGVLAGRPGRAPKPARAAPGMDDQIVAGHRQRPGFMADRQTPMARGRVAGSRQPKQAHAAKKASLQQLVSSPQNNLKIGSVLNLRTTTSQKYDAVPRRARI